MALVDILQPDFFFPDGRGTLTQIVSGGYKQINAVFSRKDSVRGGWHYHTRNKEAFYIISGRVTVSLKKDGSEESYTFKTGDMFRIDEYVKHTFEYVEDSYLVVLYTDCVENEDGTKDIWTD